MIRKTIESYTKAIEGILDSQGNPVKWFVVVRTTIWVLWIIPVVSWEEDPDQVSGGRTLDRYDRGLIIASIVMFVVTILIVIVSVR